MRKFISLLMIFIFVGCSANSSNNKVLYLTTIHWSSEDLHQIAEAMVTSILKSEFLSPPSKKVFSFLKIKNSTYDHIDTNSIIEMIKTDLVKSDRAIIVNIQKNRQQYPQKIKKINKHLGIDGIFYGEISAIYQKNSSTKDMFFKFTLNLIDVESAEIVWSDEKKIRKIHEKEYIGW